MALPEQIRKQSEAIQEMYKQMETAETGAPADVEAPADTTGADENTVSEVATPAVDEQKPADEGVSEETIAQKYRTLQGMYNAEVPRLHHQNREMTQRLQHLEQLLASMSASQPSSTPTQQEASRYVSDKDVEEYGESIDVMRRVSREELASLTGRLAQIEQALQQMQTNIVPQVQAVAHRQQMSAEQQFWADLASSVPNFRTVNADEAFQSWLLEIDPLTGITRQTYLEDAQRGLDSKRVANIFRTWLNSTGQNTVAHSGGPTTSATSELEKQVAPGRSRGTGTPAPANKGKIYTPQDIQKFFNDVRSGKFKGREQERDRIERDIFAAQRENRIQRTA